MSRADGIHFGTSETPSDGILSLLRHDSPTIMNEPEAKHWYGYMAGIGRTASTVWRASPQRRPADVGWDAHAFSRDIFKSLDEHHDRYGIYPTDILLLNELNLDYERGDAKNDGGAFDTNPANWPGLYRKIARFLDELIDRCSERAHDRGFAPRWWFQGWAPGHGELNDDIATIWAPVAQRYDGICYHAYTTTEEIVSTTQWYRNRFPNKPLLLGEWNTINLGAPNSQQRYDEERRIRLALRGLCDADPLLECCYFIHYWGEDARHEHDIRDNPERLAIWTEPLPDSSGGDNYVFPIPVDEQGNEWQASYTDILNDTPAVAAQFGIAPHVLFALFLAESGVRLTDQERWHIWTDEAKDAIARRDLLTLQAILQRGAAKGTNDFSFGVGHRAYRWSKLYEGKPYDIDAMLRFRKIMLQDHGYAMRDAAESLAENLRKFNGDELEALCRYNKPDGSYTQNVRANYAEKLGIARSIFSPGVNTDEPPIVVPPKAPSADTMQFDDGYRIGPSGYFTNADPPQGCILHGSRSDRASNPIEAEYLGTANWAVNNGKQLGWNATIGEYRVAVHLLPDQWGWNARAASRTYLAVEFAQPTADVAITDGQVAAFVAWWQNVVKPRWPSVPDYFPTHAEVEVDGETGVVDGKTDVFPFDDPRADELRDRIMARLGAAVPPPVVPDDAERTKLINALGYLSGDVAQKLEVSRAQLALPATPVPVNKMTKAQWRERSGQLERIIHEHYARDGEIKDELIAVGTSALGR